jgi:hypothetical protein
LLLQKESNQRKAAPNAAPLRGSQHFEKGSGHENNSAGVDGLYPKETSSRQPQTIFVETPDPFPKCWRSNTGILECNEFHKKSQSEDDAGKSEKKHRRKNKNAPFPQRREPNSVTSKANSKSREL